MSANPIAELNRLRVHDYLEASPLIDQCLENGIYQWTNPLFVAHLQHRISTWASGGQSFGSKAWGEDGNAFMRAVIYARHLAAVMPDGIDDEVKNYFERLGSGHIGENDYPLCCYWPRVYPSIWNPKLFWQGRQIQAARSEAAVFNAIYANRLRGNKKVFKELPLSNGYDLFVNWSERSNRFIVGINEQGRMVGSRQAFAPDKLSDAAEFVQAISQRMSLCLAVSPAEIQEKVEGVKVLASS